MHPPIVEAATNLYFLLDKSANTGQMFLNLGSSAEVSC